MDKNNTFTIHHFTANYCPLKRGVLTTALFIICFGSFSQKILILENSKTLKNIKYYQGNGLMWSTNRIEKRMSDDIFNFTDSTIIFEIAGEVKFKDITTIYRHNWLVETARGLTFIGGIGYFSIDSFNRLINHDYPVVLPETLAISGGLVAVSLVLMPFKYRKIHTGKYWSMRVIDKNEFSRYP